MKIKYETEREEYINATVDYHYTIYYPEDPKGFKVSELIEVLQHIYANKGDPYIRASKMELDDMFNKNIGAVCVCEWEGRQIITFRSGCNIYHQ